MGRGAYEQNYTRLNLPELEASGPDAAPVPIALPADLVGQGPAVADLFCAENLAWLETQAGAWAGRCQLLYLDPPFGSGKAYAARVEGGRGRQSQAVRAYEDNRSFDAYLAWLYQRLAFARDLLCPSGMLYVHLDWHAVHYAKVELDRLFGRERFLNEIIWCYYGPSPIRSAFKRKHDNILVYTRSAGYFFDADAVRIPYDQSTVRTFESSRKAGFGRMPDLARGKVPEDWWYIPVVAREHLERVGYETQKPEKLLERIVRASSRPGDLVGDFFAGSGTTGVVANRLGRDVLLVDRNPIAVEKTLQRLARLEPSPRVRLWRYLTPGAEQP
jgi:site-specific DNA-methyltransferase (adenine-specific)